MTKPVTVLLTGDEHDFIVKHASESGRTVSNAIRQLVRAVMAAEDE